MTRINSVPLLRAVAPRDPTEPHRAATPLELFFDLVFVVAIASAAAQLHHGYAEGHWGDLVGFAMAFFAIWWAWLNYTWYASAYDNDDVVFRLLSFTIMAGALLLAAGVPDLFADGQSAPAVWGYCIMRLGMAALWLRAAASDPTHRSVARWYAGGIVLVQVFWVLRLAVHDSAWLVPTFAVGVVGELLVPFFAERRGETYTTFHPGHIAERYGCLTLIVLGEVMLSTVQAVQVAMAAGPAQGRAHGMLPGLSHGMLPLIVGALLIVFATWWTYFKHDNAALVENPHSVWAFGYGHLVVFASVASTGSALAAAVDVVQGEAHASHRAVGFALAGAVAAYALSLALINLTGDGPSAPYVVPAVVTAAAVLTVAAVGLPMGTTVLLVGLVMALGVVHHVWSSHDE